MAIKLTQSKSLSLSLLCALSLTPLLLGGLVAKAAMPTSNKPSHATTKAAMSTSNKPSYATTKAATNTAAVIKLGSKGAMVTKIQNFLKQKGLYAGKVNGLFDSSTSQAVKKFQQSKHLKADGIVGSRTRNAMKGAGLA